MTVPSPSLAGLDVLLVEDESMVSLLLEDMLHELGAGNVRPASRLDTALALAAERRPDLAVLDVNIAGKAVFPLAQKLTKDRVPVLFITGYGRDGLGTEWADCEVLQKPLTLDQLEMALHRALARG